jgi:hypothetical protein
VLRKAWKRLWASFPGDGKEHPPIPDPEDKMRKIMKSLVFYLIQKFHLDFYKIEELQSWSHCGCCGKFINNDIVPKHWPWGLCNNCQQDGEICHKI